MKARISRSRQLHFRKLNLGATDMKRNKTLATLFLAIVFMAKISTLHAQAEPIQVETLQQATTSWDGTPYKAYPEGQPQLTILKITIAPHSTMPWHSHPLPNAGYLVSGELTVEKMDGTNKHFTAGQVIAETVDSIHRGITGDQPAVLIVFYAGTPKLPLSQAR
jgi:quercetin dioxygenase-like cupin family protein